MLDFSLSLALQNPGPASKRHGSAPPGRLSPVGLSPASTSQVPPLPEAPPTGGALFFAPKRSGPQQRRQQYSEFDAMGLPEERGRSGSGSGSQVEAGAWSHARSWSPPPEVSRSAHVSSLQRYRQLHRRSVEEPRGEPGPGRALRCQWGQK